MIKLSFFFYTISLTGDSDSRESDGEVCRQNTSPHAHFSQFLSVPPARTALFFTFTRTCVAQEPTGLKSSACLLKESSPYTYLVSPWYYKHYIHILLHAILIVSFDTEFTAHDWNQLSQWDSLVTWLTPLKPQISQRVRSVALDTSSCLMKETHQQCLKCETTYCSFEASSPHVSKNRSSWDSPRIDLDFARSETAELDARGQFPRNS